jgi:CMP-N-acetylneuraminic acid synthetase/spore coat polysaccharide biosynthesis predicted glycosyltransferase SpsG
VSKVLAVIPARGGSKGIPRKNIRLMCGKPLISYAIHNAMNCPLITDCVVTTDDSEIAAIARMYGCETVARGERLSADAVTLDPVVYDAVRQMEEKKGYNYDVVITMQPTSPLMQLSTLEGALRDFIDGTADTMISVVNHPHLSWSRVNGKIVPNYKERLNRQQLPPDYMETGAFFITRRQFVVENSRLGKNITVYEVPEREAYDIDSVEDWIVSESIMHKKNIIFRCDGMKKLGMGHIYNCITMAFSLIEHNVLFVTRKDCLEGLEKIKSTNFKYVTIDSDADLERIISEFKPNIWVNDCLNTDAVYMKWLKQRVERVVSIEDLGDGTQYADAVINALYENKRTLCPKTYEGPEYVCLRNEFLLESPKAFSNQVQRIFIMFGGTDPSNLNIKLYKAAKKLHQDYPDLIFDFVTGIGYPAKENGLLSKPEDNIFIHENVLKVTDYMKLADVAVTSQGRTVFEIASMGVPAVVLSQNKREMEHTFATMKNGFLNLGMGNYVTDDAIVNTLKWLIETPSIRKNMHDLMLKQNLKDSALKIKHIILGEEG